MQTTWKRIITAVILIPLVVFGIIFTSNTTFALIVAFILSLAAWEWSRITKITRGERFFYLLILWIVFVLAYFLPVWMVLLFGLVWWIVAIFLVVNYPRVKRNLFTGWPGCLLSLLVFVPCWIGFDTLHTKNVKFLFLNLLIVWATDTGAYFVGKKWGKYKLAPQVSPNKTIEGFIGGIILAVLISIGYVLIWQAGIKGLELLTLTILTSLFSVVGDLFESMLKRIANVKDSGNLLPGHGGVLDRIDSLLAAIPVWTLGLLVFMYI